MAWDAEDAKARKTTTGATSPTIFISLLLRGKAGWPKQKKGTLNSFRYSEALLSPFR
jgi:hypothetical protein